MIDSIWYSTVYIYIIYVCIIYADLYIFLSKACYQSLKAPYGSRSLTEDTPRGWVGIQLKESTDKYVVGISLPQKSIWPIGGQGKYACIVWQELIPLVYIAKE